MKVGQEITTCQYDSATINQTVVNTNQENTGYLAVSVVPGGTTDNATGLPVPLVTLSADGNIVYGALATINTATGRCGVITSGIVPFRKSGASVAGDLTKGVVGTSNAGQVVGDATAGNGRGTVVGRVSNTSPILWVDLDANNNAIA